MIAQYQNKPNFVKINSEEFLSFYREVPGSEFLIPNSKEIFDKGNSCMFTVGQDVCGFFGVYPMWPGVGECFALFRFDRRVSTKFALRSMRNLLSDSMDQMNLHRVQTVINKGCSDLHYRWLDKMGFSFEGLMVNYTSDKKSIQLYAITR